MRQNPIPLGPVRRRNVPVVTCMLGVLLAALMLPTAVSAEDAEAAQSVAQRPPDTPQHRPRWTASVEAVVLERLGGVNQTLVQRVPGTTPFFETSKALGAEALNSNQLQAGFAPGAKVRLQYSDDSGYGVEATYLNISFRSTTAAVGPDNPADWLVMRAPGTFWQTQDFPYQAMTWSAETVLQSAETNARLYLSRSVTLLAGFRWFRLTDGLQGGLTPPDLTAPSWKATCPACTISGITPGGPAGNYPPFWNTSTTNNLYGVQVGVDGTLLEHDRFSLGGQIKAGLFVNNATQSTGVSLQKVVYGSTATTSQAAFASELALHLKYHLMTGLALKGGYELLWLNGVALAPGQVQETYTGPSSVRALGVNAGSNILFQGFTLGLEFSF